MSKTISLSLGEIMDQALEAAGADKDNMGDPIAVLALNIGRRIPVFSMLFDKNCGDAGTLVFDDHLAVNRTLTIIAQLEGAWRILDVMIQLTENGSLDLDPQMVAEEIVPLAERLHAMVWSLSQGHQQGPQG